MRVQEGMELLDVALREYKTIEALLFLVKSQDLLPDQELVAGQELKVSQGFIKQPDAFEQTAAIVDQVKVIRSMEGQDLLDLAIQEYGSLDQLMKLSKDNQNVIEDLNGLPGLNLIRVESSTAAASATATVLQGRGLKISTNTEYTPPAEGLKPLKDWDKHDFAKPDYY